MEIRRRSDLTKKLREESPSRDLPPVDIEAARSRIDSAMREYDSQRRYQLAQSWEAARHIYINY
jgi:hypothetical protein